ncbi:MAG: transposase, partial [Alphaproteobacteria bacterium]|nr:transposase [Alphaproteobacteria bacterium]
MTYSLDFRQKVLRIKAKENLSFAAVAKRFDVGLASVVRWSKSIVPKKTRNRPATKINMDDLQKDVITYPDAYQYERAKRLGVSKNCVWHALKRLNVTYKKNPCASQSGSRKTLCFLP